MDKAKILRQCNEIERALNKLYVKRQDSITSEERIALINMLGVIVTEITAPPKSNGDKIRAMTDEELAHEINGIDRRICNKVEICEKDINCYACRLEWLKQEVSEDETD